MLGVVAGRTVRNRATPLFRLYSSFTKDFADTTVPQHARSLMITQTHKYVQPATGLGAQPEVPDYAFAYDVYDPNDPDEPGEEAPPAPRAAVYVLTTQNRARSEWPPLIPLHLMDKEKPGGQDYLLSTPTDLQALHNSGYNLRTIQGYIYQPCTPEPQCIPPSAQKFYRSCKVADNDCAAFLGSECGAFQSAG
jgi:hypothetical protein